MTKLQIRIVLLLVYLSVPIFAAQGETGLVPFERDGKWGYQDAQGQTIIAPRFVVAQEFSPEGIAAVADQSGWAYINTKGRVVIRPLIVDNGPDYFSEGLARFKSRGKVGFFNNLGSVSIKPQFDFALPFAEGLAAVCLGCREEAEGEHRVVKGGRWGFINKQGVVVIPLKYEAADSFQDGKAGVKFAGKGRVIDRSGRFVMARPIGTASMEQDGTIVLQLRAEGPNGTIGDSLLRYAPGHHQYDEILQHVGGLKKGEVKQVPPWPTPQSER